MPAFQFATRVLRSIAGFLRFHLDGPVRPRRVRVPAGADRFADTESTWKTL